MARLQVARCAAGVLEGREAETCVERSMPELRAALTLDPMNASTHAQVAQVLLTGWPLLGEPARVEARAIVERAVGMNPGNQDLQRAWLGINRKTQG